MQTLYKNEGSLALRWAMLAAGVVILAACAADYFAFVPLFGVNQHLDITLLLVGSVLALVGLKEVTGFVREIAVDEARTLTITRGLGRATVAGEAVSGLVLYAAGSEAKRMSLATSSGTYVFPMKNYPAERFAETIKAIAPRAVVEHRA